MKAICRFLLSMQVVGVIAGVFIFSGISFGAEEPGKETLKQITICRDTKNSGTKAVRTLRLYESSDQCRATYSKQNVEQIVGANRSIPQCGSILDGIRKNLEESHWTCRKRNVLSVLESRELKENPTPAF